jgi:hypothetical protein
MSTTPHVDRTARTDPQLGAPRIALVLLLVRAGYHLQRLAVRLLPPDHSFRIFKEELLEHTDGVARKSLMPRYGFAPVDFILVALAAFCALCVVAALVLMVAIGAFHILVIREVT